MFYFLISRRKKILVVNIFICIAFTFFPITILSSSNSLCKYSYEDNNGIGVAVHIKSTSKNFISGKVKVTYYVGKKPIQARTKTFSCIKNSFVDIDGPDSKKDSFDDNYSYKVKVYNVKIVKIKDAGKKVKTWIRRKHTGDGYSDTITLYVKNMSRKAIKYNATLVMRYAGKDAFGEDCTGQYYNMFKRKGKIKPGKTIKLTGTTWKEYKIKSIKYVNAYY